MTVCILVRRSFSEGGTGHVHAAVGIGMDSETRSVEHGNRVGSSRTFDIANPAALGALPGSRRKRAKRGGRA